jgi:hypothetical protein
MSLFAGDVKLNDSIRGPLSSINKKAQGGLEAALGRIGSRQKASSVASGRVEGTYAPAELARGGAQASSGIEDALLGALGNTSYDEMTKDHDQEQNLALANEIARLNAPSVLEQVLSGLGGGAKAAGGFASLYKSLNRNQTGGSLPPSLSLYSPYSGYARYS